MSTMQNMDEQIFNAVRAAVTVAKNEQIRHIPGLRSRLSSMGFSEDVIDKALLMWADHARRQPYTG